MRANLGLLQLRRSPIPVAVPTRKGGKMPPPDGSLLLTGRLIGATNFACPLPKALNLIHREEARQFDVMNGTSGYSNTGYSRCHCRVSHVENHHHTGTIGSPSPGHGNGRDAPIAAVEAWKLGDSRTGSRGELAGAAGRICTGGSGMISRANSGCTGNSAVYPPSRRL